MSTEISVTVRRAVIETNLEQCRDTAARSFVMIGRWLNAAKDEGVVGHGEWGKWVQEHAGLSERGAQRCMQIAREVPEGSLLEGLSMTKVRALLALPAAEREDAAREMDAASLTGTQVEEKVRQLREQRDEALRVISAQRNASQKATDKAVKEAIAQERRDRAEMEEELRKTKSLLESANIGQKRSSRMYGEQLEKNENLRVRLQAAEQERARLEEQLKVERANVGISPLAQAKIDAQNAQMDDMQERIVSLQRKLNEKDDEIDQLTDRLDEAQVQAARGSMAGEERCAPGVRILSAIGSLMTQAGNAPGELGRQLGDMDEDTRNLLIGQASAVGAWAMRVIAACGGDTHAF